MTTLQLVLVLLASAVLVVALFRSLNLPPVLGYLLVGAAIGPHALDLVPDSEATHHLAEFGVVFLMFSIGLEFSLPRLYSMKRTVFGLGLAQVTLTVAINIPVAMLAGLNPLGVVAAAIFVAGVLVGADSMSRAVGVPTYLADVIVATSLLAVLVAALFTQYRVRR